MLESLGYREAAARARGRPDPLQHLLDPRVRRQPLHRAPRRGQAPEARTARADRRRGGVLGAVGQGGGLRALPVRRRRLRPRPGAPPRGVPHLRVAHRPGLLRVRGLHRAPARPPRAALPGVGADQRRLQLPLLLLHRALHPRARGQPALRGARRRRSARWPPTGCARSRCSARTSTPTGATCATARRLAPGRRAGLTLDRPARSGWPGGARELRRAAARARRRRGHRAHPLHQPPPEGHARGCDPRARRAASVCEHIHLPLQSGSTRILKAMRRTYDRERYLDRVALIREHVPDVALTTDIIVGFPGESEEDFAQTLEVRRAGPLRRRLHVPLLAPPRHRGRRDHRGPRPPPGEGGAHGAPRGGRPAPRPRARPALRGAHRGGARRRAPRAPTPSGCAGAPATTRSSTSPASPPPAS